MSTQFAPIWNNASVDFTCIKANVTDSNSGSNSTLLDLQVGGSSRFKVDKSGTATVAGPISFNNQVVESLLNFYGGSYTLGINSWEWKAKSGGGFTLTGAAPGNLGWLMRVGTNATASLFEVGLSGEIKLTSDTILARDAANTLAQRNGTSAQALRIYNTYTDASNYERAKIAWSSNVLQIGTEKLGTGAARALELQTDGTTRLTIDTSGFVYANGGKIGLGSNGNALIETTSQTSNVRLGFNNAARLQIDTSTITILDSDIATIRFGSTASFPGIKRNGAALNFRLANDSADCDITAAKATLSATLDLTIRTVTYGATMAIDAALGNKIAITLTGNGTISNPTNAVDGRVLVFRLRQDATGSRIPVWDTKYAFVGDLATVTLSTAANAIDRVAFEYDSTDDKWYCISFIKGS